VAEFLERVENQIQNRRLLKRGGKVLVAVSGGLDSTVLLHALNLLAKKSGWKISVAHFNHQLRGRASDADKKLVRKTAAELELPIVVESADVKEFARKSKLSVEMAARKLRHEFFARAARERKIKTVVLAHHADDQVELFFLRLLRGAGGEGLAGMKWQSPSPADKSISLVRPLLDFSKSELTEFARENKIKFRHDATNFSSDFLRNRIRNELLPLLRKKYQPGLNRAILRLMEIVGTESDFVGEIARAWLAQPKTAFENLAIAVQRRVLQSQLPEVGIATDFELIESLRRAANQFVSVGANISVARNEFGKIKLRTELKPDFNVNELGVNLAGRAADMNFDDVKFTWKFDNGSRGRSPHQTGREIFDADKVGNKIVLRHWRAGDRFQPIGLKAAAKLQDLFTNAKIPRERRRNLVLAEAAGGEIFWVEGLRISENFKLTTWTKQRLIWTWLRVQR
jgi:tRNA(Ile)-lysidine synthase